jgi:DNA invertase Pin-like site-specific DNA recombinase
LGELRGLILTRVSSAQQEFSPQHQYLACKRWCEENGVEVVERIHETISGRVSEDRRLFKQLLAREFDVLVVFKIDRIARSARIIHSVAEDLTKRGRYLVAVSEGLDTRQAMGKIFLAILGALAEIEGVMISERAKAAHEGRRERGLKHLPRIPLGFGVVAELEDGIVEIGPVGLPEGANTQQTWRYRRQVEKWQRTRPWHIRKPTH